LQRTAGNRAVAALLAGAGASRPVLQRAIDRRVRMDFGLRYEKLLAKLRIADKLESEHVDAITALSADGDQDGGWLKREVFHLWDAVETLRLMTKGAWKGMSPRQVVETFVETPKRTYEAVAAAPSALRIQSGSGAAGGGTGGGGFDHPEMASYEAGLAGQLAGAGVENAAIEARIDIALQEIDRAYHAHRAAATRPLDRVALVFVGPEWFFRRPDRPYTKAEQSLVIQRMKAVSRVYPDMVIMPGTIVWGDLKSGRWAGLSNTAPVLWMGEVIRLVHKSADCGDTDGLVTPDAFTAAGSGKADSLFDVANLRFALDICVDHHQKRARREYEARYGEKSLRKGEGVDVHIVTGAGQVASPDSVVAKPGGLVISADASEGLGKVEVVTGAPEKVETGDSKRFRRHYETGRATMETLTGRELSGLQYPLSPGVQAGIKMAKDPKVKEASELAKQYKQVTSLHEPPGAQSASPAQVTVTVVNAGKGEVLDVRKTALN
jgi:hypothetical protein